MIRLLRKELAFQWRRNRRGLTLWLLLLLSISTVLALIIWRDRWRVLSQQLTQQIQSQQGLLELRVNQHRTTVLDWGHWDTMYGFAGGEDPGFVERELLPSSIAADRQLLMVVDSRGSLLASEPALPRSRALQRCIQERLLRLRQLTGNAAADVSFGLYCRDAGQVLVGAGTGIRPSSGGGPERGWLIHMSALERPSYNASLNQTFRAIDRAIALQDRPSGASAQPIAGISELLGPGERYVMLPRFSPLETARRAAGLSIPAWFTLNLVALALVPAGLLVARQQRLPGRLRVLQDLRADRKRRHQISRVLMHRRQLLMTISSNPATFQGCWVGALRLETGEGEPGRNPQSLQNLALMLDQRVNPLAMAPMDQQTLVLAFRPPAGTGKAESTAALDWLRQVLESAWPQASASPCRGMIAPLQAGAETEQLLELHAASARSAAGEPLQLHRPLTPRRAGPAAARHPEPAEHLPPGCLDPVMRMVADQAVLLYNPIQVPSRRDHENGADVAHAPVLQTALERLRRSGAQGEAVGLPAALTVAGRRDTIPPAELASLPEKLRRRLVLEVEESLLMEDCGALRSAALEWKRLSIRIAITDFGNSDIPIQTIFQLHPSFLKLSADYTHCLHHDNVDGLVDFLLGYCRYKRCTLVLQGVETRSQLQYWQRRGVQAFQGPACGQSA